MVMDRDRVRVKVRIRLGSGLGLQCWAAGRFATFPVTKFGELEYRNL